MKAITVEPHKPDTAHLEDIPEPDVRAGSVLVEAVVLPDGSVGEVQVVRSLDNVFGLDQEALKAAKQWKFMPGTRFGQPVPVLVTIELTFTLR